MEKTCSKCKSSFGCKNEAPGCWCENLHLSNETLRLLKDSYENCLCPECLKEIELAQDQSGLIKS